MAKEFDIAKAFGLEGIMLLPGTVGVKAGILEGATSNESGQNVAEYAACNEFGTTHIPSRPFLRKTYDDKESNWVQGLGNALARLKPAQALKMLGIRMQDDIVATIKSNMPPQNADSTIARKTKGVIRGGQTVGSHNPGTLIDTGSMINSVNYEVFGA